MNELLILLQILLLALLLAFAARKEKEYLALFSAASALMANLFIFKQIKVLGLDLTPTDGFALFSTLAISLGQERFGKEFSQRLVFLNFALLALFIAFSQIHLAFTPSLFDSSDGHYAALFSMTPRLLGASLIAFFFSQQLDRSLFGFLRNGFFKEKLGQALFLSALISQSVDTFLFTTLGLYGLIASPLAVFGAALLIKMIAIPLSTAMTTALLKRRA